MTVLCTALLSAVALLCTAQAEEHLRPAAIIPWSQYQARMGQVKERMSNLVSSNRRDDDRKHVGSSSAENAEGFQENSYVGNYARSSPLLPDQLPPKEPDGQAKLRSQYANVIRPQIRGRTPAEPADFATNKFRENLPGGNMKFKPFKPAEFPQTLNQLPRIQRPSMIKTEKKPAEPSTILNGVPMYAGSWEDGQPRYLSDRRPVQHSATTFLQSEALSHIPSQESAEPLYRALDPNIVNSIFSQSQAKGSLIPTAQQIQPAQGQALLDRFLADGASLDQISKLAKNLLGVGDNGGSGGGGSLLDAMTSALRGGPKIPPTSSAAHDGASQFSVVKPQSSSMIEKLLSQAAVALNDSLKQKQLKDSVDQAFGANKWITPAPTETSTNQPKITKDRENSLKLLENMPEEQRKILEAAIISGEIDPDAPALKSLVKDDRTEESKKEKQSRLLEWIRSNRPSKSNDVIVTSDKLPYYGKYCGSLAEQPILKKQFRPSGALWAVDEHRFIVSKFFFQPGSLLTENVTFWLGPANETGDVLRDIMPSQNGFYIQPKPIDVAIFALEELPPLAATARKSVPAITTFTGLAPIIANTTRVRRDAVINVTTDAQPPKDSRKPIELLVKGGVVQLKPGIAQQEDKSVIRAVPDTTDEDTQLSSGRKIIQAGFRLQQPEFEQIDTSVPQPLEWYAGFQPLLLTLPATKHIKQIHWISLRDHKRQETIASVLLPNGPAFQVPGVVQLRPLSPNGVYNISSGAIQILDIKTIRINNFSLRTEGAAIWFMVGKDILPNSNGHIVPLFDEKTKQFDCQSLRDYYDETVLLRLPGQTDMKDVFWFSIFSMQNSVSYSHIYLPYNDIQLIPDLSATATPTCKYKA